MHNKKCQPQEYKLVQFIGILETSHQICSCIKQNNGLREMDGIDWERDDGNIVCFGSDVGTQLIPFVKAHGTKEMVALCYE